MKSRKLFFGITVVFFTFLTFFIASEDESHLNLAIKHSLDKKKSKTQKIDATKSYGSAILDAKVQKSVKSIDGCIENYENQKPYSACFSKIKEELPIQIKKSFISYCKTAYTKEQKIDSCNKDLVTYQFPLMIFLSAYQNEINEFGKRLIMDELNLSTDQWVYDTLGDLAIKYVPLAQELVFQLYIQKSLVILKNGSKNLLNLDVNEVFDIQKKHDELAEERNKTEI